MQFKIEKTDSTFYDKVYYLGLINLAIFAILTVWLDGDDAKNCATLESIAALPGFFVWLASFLGVVITSLILATYRYPKSANIQ